MLRLRESINPYRRPESSEVALVLSLDKEQAPIQEVSPPVQSFPGGPARQKNEADQANSGNLMLGCPPIVHGFRRGVLPGIQSQVPVSGPQPAWKLPPLDSILQAPPAH